MKPSPAPSTNTNKAPDPPLVVFEAAESSDFNSLVLGHAQLLADSEDELFHEAGVWMPHTQEWLVTSNRLATGTPEEHVRISAIHVSGRVRQLTNLEKEIVMGNGGTTDHAGGAFLLSQGWQEQSGAVFHLSKDLTATRLGPPDGVVFNSPNDIVWHGASRTVLFTDPAYGYEAQGFRTTHNGRKGVWAARCDELADEPATEWAFIDVGCAEQPNGLLLSPCGKFGYVSDVWNPNWATSAEKRLSRCGCKTEGVARRVLAFNVEKIEGVARLQNRRIFFDLEAEMPGGAEETGYPDGLKCDTLGNVYAGCGDGVRVYSPTGAFLGRMKIEGGVANLAFGGPDGKTLLAFNETRAIAIDMAVSGALGPYSGEDVLAPA